MYSDHKAKCRFSFIEHSLTKEELKMINSGYNMSVEEGKLLFTKPASIEAAEKKKEIDILHGKLMATQATGKEPKVSDVMELLNKLLN